MLIQGRYDKNDWYAEVEVDGKMLDPKPSQHVYNHSPDGFAWGYGGSGPAQLALAILLASGCSKELALAHYQDFKWEFLANLPRDTFTLDVDIDAWLLSKVI